MGPEFLGRIGTSVSFTSRVRRVGFRVTAAGRPSLRACPARLADTLFAPAEHAEQACGKLAAAPQRQRGTDLGR